LKELTLKEAVTRCRISKRTFEYYQSLGLIPPPKKRVGIGGRGVYGYYSPNIPNLFKTINDLQSHGQSLAEIKKSLDASVLERFKAVLKKWGFSQFKLPELYNTPILNESFIRKIGSPVYSSEVFEEGIAEGNLKDKHFEESVHKNLNWWDKDEQIETLALAHISTQSDSVIRGMSVAILLILDDVGSETDITIKVAKQKMSEKITTRCYEVRILNARVNTRLTEILGRFEGQNKNRWQTIERSTKDELHDYQRVHKQAHQKVQKLLDERQRLLNKKN